MADPSRGETRAERAERLLSSRGTSAASSGEADTVEASSPSAPPPVDTAAHVAETTAARTATATATATHLAPSAMRDYSDEVYVFEPHNATMPSVEQYVRSLWERRRLIVELAKAELRGKHADTALGRLWSLVDPLFQSALYFFLFSVIRGSDADSSRPMAFLPVLIGNMFLFRLSMGALSEGGTSVRKGKGLMMNSAFPRALLPLVAIYKGLLQFVAVAIVFPVIFVILGGTLGPGIFVLPLLFFIQLVMNVGVALLMSTIIVFFRDAQNAMNYVNRLIFLTTPIIYPVGLLPSGIQVVLMWQPFFSLFASYQKVIGGTMPSPGMIFLAMVWAIGLLVLGASVFMRHEREFAIHL